MNLDALMDTPRIYTALAEWGACILYVLLFRQGKPAVSTRLPLPEACSYLSLIRNLQELFLFIFGFPA